MRRQAHDLDEVARSILDENLYMVLGTADVDGRPWVSPVYYAAERYTEFFWVSRPEASHSLNIGNRPGVSLVVFDSHAPISTGQAVYMAAQAGQVAATELERGLEIYSRRTLEHGGRAWGRLDVLAPAELRLYRALVSEHWVLEPDRDVRTPVTV